MHQGCGPFQDRGELHGFREQGWRFTAAQALSYPSRFMSFGGARGLLPLRRHALHPLFRGRDEAWAAQDPLRRLQEESQAPRAIRHAIFAELGYQISNSKSVYSFKLIQIFHFC